MKQSLFKFGYSRTSEIFENSKLGKITIEELESFLQCFIKQTLSGQGVEGGNSEIVNGPDFLKVVLKDCARSFRQKLSELSKLSDISIRRNPREGPSVTITREGEKSVAAGEIVRFTLENEDSATSESPLFIQRTDTPFLSKRTCYLLGYYLRFTS
jgi:hypothetical protein